MTAYVLSRYLAKYVAGIDEGNMIYVAPGNDYAGGKQNLTPELVVIMLQRLLPRKLM
jgi:hypothetical protein